MARININKLEQIDKTINRVHDTVSGTYSVFDFNGVKYFQIDTYGKPGREMPEKISQSIQFDQSGARQLIELISKEFEL